MGDCARPGWQEDIVCLTYAHSRCRECACACNYGRFYNTEIHDVRARAVDCLMMCANFDRRNIALKGPRAHDTRRHDDDNEHSRYGGIRELIAHVVAHNIAQSKPYLCTCNMQIAILCPPLIELNDDIGSNGRPARIQHTTSISINAHIG